MTLAALPVFFATTRARADVELAPLFCDHAVLQRGVPIPVWGTAAPGETVRVTYLDQQHETVADGGGRWTVRLEPLPAGGTGTLVARGCAEHGLLQRRGDLARCGFVRGSPTCAGPSAKQQTVGHRLVLVARARTYGQPVAWSAPTFRAVTTGADGTVRADFDGADGGLRVRGDTLRGFTVAGADGCFVPAAARVEGGVVISSPRVPVPVAVRYAWANDPAGCNLYNASGLPAAPFRTDGAKK